MSLATTTVSVWKGAIPAACFAVNGEVRARVLNHAGCDTLDMTITAIVVGSGNTDTVTLSYESDCIGSAALAPCDLHAFYCLEGCCNVVYDMSVQGESRGIDPREQNTHENGLVGATPIDGQLWPLGRLPRTMQVDSIAIDLPDFLGDLQTLTCELYASGAKVLDVDLTSASPGFYALVHRASFEAAFSGGRIAAGSAIWLLVKETSQPESTEAAHAAVVHFLGRWA